MRPNVSSSRVACREPLWSLRVRFACHGWRGKGTFGQAAALRWSGLRFAPTALCSSVSRPRRRTRYVRFAHTAQTAAASQLLIRAARGGRKPWPCRPRQPRRAGRSPGTNSPLDCSCPGSPARRSRSAPQPARTRLCESVWLSPRKTTAGTARQAVLGGGDFCGDEQHRPGLGARSAHPHLTRRGCLSGVSEANVASSAARARTEQRSGVGAKRRPPQHEPPPGTACGAALNPVPAHVREPTQACWTDFTVTPDNGESAEPCQTWRRADRALRSP